MRNALSFLPVALLVACFGALPACSSSEPTADAASSGSGTQAGPTFHRDVEPILQKSCMGCHSPGNIAPFSLMTYDEAKPYALLMHEQTEGRTMPPWGGEETDECKPRFGWQDDVRLSDADIETIHAWQEAGAPEGDVADAPPAFVPPAPGLASPDVVMEPVAPYVTSGDSDQFRCFVLDPKLTKDVFIHGMGIVAGNAAVVHHALVYTDPNNEAASKADASGGYDCFGGPGVSSTALAMGWAPGAVPIDLPDDVGMKIKANTKFVMQIHYHPAGKTADPDSTKFQIRFGETKPKYNYVTALVGNFGPLEGLMPGPNDEGGPEFRIPANVAGHTETMEYVSPDIPELYIYGVGAHMHYVGTDMKIDIERKDTSGGEPKNECLVQTPRWDFSWQRLYTYDADIASLPRVRPGDKTTYRCTYDNTTNNPFVKKALADEHLNAPRDVFLGESTLDEMCLGVFALLYEGEPLDF